MKLVAARSLFVTLAPALSPVVAFAQIPAELQAKVDTYKKKLVEWAANPAIVNAVKESKAKGGLVAGMNNSKWDELGEKDALVMSFQTSEAGKLLAGWDADTAITKLYLRD